MSDKISKRLTMGERFVLLNNLPQEGDLVTFKILRKLRETLAPTEAEIKEFSFKNSFRCSHQDFDERGKSFRCEVEVESAEVPPKCHIHDLNMKPSGRVSWDSKKWEDTKEIWFGPKANQIIVDTLKKVCEEDKKVNDDLLASLYDKFVDSGEEEE